MINWILQNPIWFSVAVILLCVVGYLLARWFKRSAEEVRRMHESIAFKTEMHRRKHGAPVHYWTDPIVHAGKPESLLGVAKNADHPRRLWALELLNQHLTKNASRYDKKYERGLLELVQDSDKFISKTAVSTLDQYTQKFKRKSLQAKIDAARVAREDARQDDLRLTIFKMVTGGAQMEIDGQWIDSVQKLIGIMENLQEDRPVLVKIERDGKTYEDLLVPKSYLKVI